MFCMDRFANRDLPEFHRRKLGYRAVLLALIMPLVVSGCSYLEPSWYYDDSVSDDVVVMNAQRRLIFFSDKGVLHDRPDNGLKEKGPGHKQGQHQYRAKVICAEPSPDVVSQLALSGGLKALTQPGNSTEANLAIAAASLRLSNRTQTIQLLRDGLYRACEAYFNGVLGEDEYKNIIMGYDELLITLVAIEGLSSIGENGHTTSLLVSAQSGSTEPPSMPAGMDKSRPDKAQADRSPDSKAGNKAGSVVAGSRLAGRDVARDEDLAASKIQKIVRDYYCFQLGLKQKFYPSPDDLGRNSPSSTDGNADRPQERKRKAGRGFGNFDEKVLGHLCGGKVVEATLADKSVKKIAEQK